MKKEVENFTVEAATTSTSSNTEVESNPGELKFDSYFSSYAGIPATDDNDVDISPKPREFDVLDVLDDSSNHRRDICDYSNSTSDSIIGLKRKHPIDSDDNDGNIVYNASDITKKLNDPSFSSSPIAANPKTFSDLSFSSTPIPTNPKTFSDLSFSSSQVAKTLNITNNTATVDLLSDSD